MGFSSREVSFSFGRKQDERKISMRKKVKWNAASITLQEGCEKHCENCRQRNLRDATIKHYRESYKSFYRYFGADTPVGEINEARYNEYLGFLRTLTKNDVTIRNYQRNLITVLHFLMSEGYMKPFPMKAIKAMRNSVEAYTDDEMRLLLKKPNIRNCSFLEYETWVIINFLFSTGIRQRSLRHIQIKDIDFDNNVAVIKVTKNRKVLIMPLNQTMVSILKEFLKHRQHKSEEDWLFCNAYGMQIAKGVCYDLIKRYNLSRGVETKGVHRFRHTFAKQWILNGGNVVTLSRLLGHSNLKITQDYINLLTTDLSRQVEQINLLEKYAENKRMKL